MAILKLGDVIIGLRGSVGGVTYSEAGVGPYARAWSRGPNRRTTSQSVPRQRLGSLGAAWRALSAGDRANWGNYSTTPPETVTNSLGETIVLSGWQWFCLAVARRLVYSSSPSYTWSGYVTPITGAAVTVTASASGTAAIDYSGTPGLFSVDYCTIFVRWSAGGGQARATRNRRLVLATTAPGVTSTSFGTELLSVYGSVPVGARLTVEVYRQASTGFRSAAMMADCIVTA